MRWDSSDYEGRAVTGVDWKQWDNIAAVFAPAVLVAPKIEYSDHNSHAIRPYADAARDQRLADTRALLAQRRATAKYKRGRGMTPCPVYVAHFADGRQLRVSFWTPEKGPLDFAQGHNVAMLLGNAAPVDGYCDVRGEAVRDPHFAPAEAPTKAKKESAAARLAAICNALNAGDIETARNMAKAA